MKPRMRLKVIAASMLAGVLCASNSIAQDAPATTQPAAEIDVCEWFVFVVDANQPKANPRSLIPNTLATFMTSNRRAPDAEKGESAAKPSPIGVMRIGGRTASDSPVDVLLNLPAGSDVCAHWPRAQQRSNRLLWKNLVIGAEGPKSKPEAIPDSHWMHALRSGDVEAGAAWIRNTGDGRGERFLMYDIEFNYKSPLQIKSGGSAGELSVSAGEGDPMHDLTFYQPAGSDASRTWTSGSIELLRGTAPAAAPTDASGKKKKPAPLEPAAAFDGSDAPASQPSTTRPVAKQSPIKASATAPSTAPAVETRTVALAPSNAADAAALVAPWAERLAKAGVPATDVPIVLSILQANALDDRWLTAVYRVDGAALDRLLPLEIIPAPRKITRVGMVVVRNIDPAILNEIDALIAQCGDADYQKRKAATKLLAELGNAAIPKLEKAAKNKDPEIAHRVGQVLVQLRGVQQKQPNEE